MHKQIEIDKLVKEDLQRCQTLYDELNKLDEKMPKGALIDRNGHMYHVYRENGRQRKKVIKDSVLINKLKNASIHKKRITGTERSY